MLKIHPGHYCFLCSPRSILCLEPQTGPPQQHFVAPTPFFFFLFFYNPQRTNNQAPIQQLTMQTSFFLPSGRGVGTHVCGMSFCMTHFCVCVCVFLQCACLPHNKLCAHAINCFLSLTTRTKLVYCNKMATIHRPKTTTKDPLIDNQ